MDESKELLMKAVSDKLTKKSLARVKQLADEGDDLCLAIYASLLYRGKLVLKDQAEAMSIFEKVGEGNDLTAKMFVLTFLDSNAPEAEELFYKIADEVEKETGLEIYEHEKA